MEGAEEGQGFEVPSLQEEEVEVEAERHPEEGELTEEGDQVAVEGQQQRQGDHP